MLPLILNETCKNKSKAEKINQIFFEEALFLTLKTISIFVNINMDMKKGRTC